MNWFDFKEDYSGERDSYGLTSQDREEQRAMLQEAIEEKQNSNEPADDSPETRFTVYRGRLLADIA